MNRTKSPVGLWHTTAVFPETNPLYHEGFMTPAEWTSFLLVLGSLSNLLGLTREHMHALTFTRNSTSLFLSNESNKDDLACIPGFLRLIKEEMAASWGHMAAKGKHPLQDSYGSFCQEWYFKCILSYLFIYSLSLQDKGSNSYSVPFLMPFKALTVLWLIPAF